MTEAEQTLMREAVAQQIKYLDRFARDFRTGAAGLSVHRAGSYAIAAQATFWGMWLIRHPSRQVRRIVNSRRENCDECVREARRGWVKIDEVKHWGSLQCLFHCGCQFETRP